MGLKGKTINGTIWSGLGTFGSAFVGLMVTITLARHLTPSDFGLIEIILSLVLLIEVFSDCGFSQAIIKEKEITNSDLSSIFFLNIGVALLLYSAIFFSAPLIARFYDMDISFIRILRILSLKIVIDALGMCQTANFTRTMRFRIIAAISLSAIAVAAGLSIWGIYSGLGIWSIVIFYLSLSCCKNSLIIILSKWKPILTFNKKRINYFFRFGGVLTLIQIIDKGITSLESLCIGRVYSKADLGYFSQARKFDSMVIQTLLGVVQRVTYPALSQISDEDKLATGYREIMQLMIWAIMPIALFVFFNAESFMVVVFGNQWINAAQYLRIFAIYSTILPLFFICWNIYLVKGQVKLLFKITVFKQLFRVIAIFITLHYGLIFFAMGIVTVMVVSSLVYIYYGGKLIKYSMHQMLYDNIGAVICAVMATASVSLLNRYFGLAPTVTFPGFVIMLTLSAFLYLILCMLITKKQVRLFMQIMKLLFKKRNKQLSNNLHNNN